MNHPEEYLILLADDDRLHCTAVSEYFSKLGMRIALANDRLQAFHILDNLKPHVIIFDLQMPDIDSLQFLQTATEQNGFIPIIITGYPSDINTALDAIQNGAFDLLVKPYRVEVLHQKINQALDVSRLERENLMLSELVSLHDITSKLASTHNLEELLDIAFENCLSISNADYGAIRLLDSENDKLVLARRSNASSEVKMVNLVENKSIDEWVLSHNRSILLTSERPTPVSISFQIPEKGFSIVAPLRTSQKTVGTIHLCRRIDNEKPFTLIDLNLIEILASQIGNAIQNVHLYTSVHQKLISLSLVSTYSEKLMGLVDKYDVIGSLFETVKSNFPMDFMGFLLLQRRKHEFLYWTRGSLEQSNITEMCRRIVTRYNETAQTKLQYHRVSIRPLRSESTESELNFPLSFIHILPVSWEDFNFGMIIFGASTPLQNEGEKVALLSNLVGQTRIALTNSKLYNDMKENYIRTIKALAIAVDAKDTYTHGHSENVMNIAEELAREMNVDEKTIGTIRDAGLLHDIGKIGIPGYILNKPGPLTYEEFNGIMKTHSTLGANIIKDVPFLYDLHKLILYHHEHYDGAGYPEGLRGEQIPVGARILHVADAFEAMTSNRPYRNSLGEKEAVKRLIDGSGKEFDPAVVEAFLRIAKGKKWIEE